MSYFYGLYFVFAYSDSVHFMMFYFSVLWQQFGDMCGKSYPHCSLHYIYIFIFLSILTVGRSEFYFYSRLILDELH